MSIENLITDHIETWTTAQVQKKSGGRGRSKKSNGQSQYGIKKLRELILELAVRAKLVPQEASDETAAILLEKVADDKANRPKPEGIRTPPPLPPISDIEHPYSTPLAWDWCRLGSIALRVIDGNYGEKYPKSSEFISQGVPFFTSASVGNKGEILNPKIKYISKELNSQLVKAQCTIGDLVLTNRGARVGAVAILDQPEFANSNIGPQLTSIRTNPIFINTRFIMICIQSPSFQKRFLNTNSGTAMNFVNLTKTSEILLPIAPILEQNRIVTRVDELMALCDQLEQEQTDNSETHQLLVKTLLDTLTKATDHADFISTWKMIEQNFNLLFTTEASIDELKQTILQLAVMGKLVPQDPNDEPASVLLEKIAKEKARLVKEGKIKKQKPLPEISKDEKPFELPVGWKWTRLGDALNKITDGTHHSPPNLEQGNFLYISAKNIKTEGVLTRNATFVSREIHEEIYSRCDPEYGDLLYIKDGATTGIATINNLTEPFSMLSSVALLKTSRGLINTFLLLAMRSPFFYAEMRSEMTGVAITRVTIKKLNYAIIPLPPMAEQHHIVAKVDELLQLCDSLKDRLNNAQATQVQLADVVVGQAVETNG